jgi:hypothetical protein
MVELMLLIFPYAMIFLGVTILGQLALGRLEAQKAAILAGPTPGEQGEDFIRDRAFPGMESDRHTISFEEEEDPDIPQSYANEEPVLPYLDREDIYAGFVRISNPRVVVEVTFEDGEVKEEQHIRNSAMGNYLSEFGIMSEERGSADGREADIANLMGDRLHYSRAEAKFSYRFGGPALHGEEMASRSPDWNPDRDLRNTEFEVRNAQGEEEAGPDGGVVYYSATRNPSVQGAHAPHGDGVEFDNLLLLDMAAGLPVSLDTLRANPPVLDGYGADADDDGSVYNIKAGLPDGP